MLCRYFVSQGTFHYYSDLWSSKETFNVLGGKTVFDTQETKLATYWETPFTKICLGMRIRGEDNFSFLVRNQAADSLYTLIADGRYRNTSMGRETWKSLIGHQASLQINCNMEGFNARCLQECYSKARIGFVANEQNNCVTCDSRIGFGTGGFPDDSSTCGNVAAIRSDNGNRKITAMGYIFVH